jgi:hypothetical protein
MESRPETLLSTLEAYMGALRNKDRQQALELFAGSGIIRDPVGQSEYAGKEAVGQYLDVLFATWFYYEIRIDNYFPGSDDRMAVRWSVSGTAVNNKTADFSGISIFVFDANLRIVSIESYWHYERILAQIKDD